MSRLMFAPKHKPEALSLPSTCSLCLPAVAVTAAPLKYTDTFHLCGVHPVALLIRILPKYIPPIATDNLYFFILFCLFTTCFGPYGPSSGETQHHLYIYCVSPEDGQ
jgi:hypothetical protein